MAKKEFDEIGYWSEIKLDIIKEYAQVYLKILNAQDNYQFHHTYIDAFSGAGIHRSKTTQEEIQGSPINALEISPKFSEYHFIDLDGGKLQRLKQQIGQRDDVHYYDVDCNEILIQEIFPQIKYKDFRRALCLLDPYGLHLDWGVIQKASEMKTIEIFLNFPVMDMNRTALWSSPSKVPQSSIERMNRFWGDESWRDVAYDTRGNLFDWLEKQDNETVSLAFRKRLQEIAGFTYVPKPIPMRNTSNAIVYYLFFASHNKTGGKIAQHLFKKYKNRKMR
jgi:three-Cys-motif partner protein